jgi:thiamine-monophosphate kinase
MVIEPSRLPLPRGFRALAGACGEEAEEASVVGGEDYELLVALPPRSAKRIGERGRVAGVPLTAIGEVGEGSRGVFVLRGASLAPLASSGFEHFTR